MTSKPAGAPARNSSTLTLKVGTDKVPGLQVVVARVHVEQPAAIMLPRGVI